MNAVHSLKHRPAHSRAMRLSIVALIVVVAGWASVLVLRSVGHSERTRYTWTSGQHQRTLMFGTIYLGSSDLEGDADQPWSDRRRVSGFYFQIPFIFAFGVNRFGSRGEGQSGIFRSFAVGYLVLMFPAGFLPGRYILRLLARRRSWTNLRRMRTRRLSMGRCGGCEYDLRSVSRCCPECGRAVRRVPVSLPPRPRRAMATGRGNL